MNEQQRIFATVGLCTAIWLAWQLMFGEPAEVPSPAPPAVVDTAAPDSLPAAAAGPVAKAAPAAMPAAPPPIAEQRRAVHTPLYDGSIGNRDGAFHALTLPAFAEFDAALPSGSHVVGESLVGTPFGKQAQLMVLLGNEVVPLEFAAATAPAGPYQLAGRSSGGATVNITLTPQPSTYAWRYDVQVHNGSSAPLSADIDVLLALSSASATKADRGHGWLSAFGAQQPTPVQGVFGRADKVERKSKVTGPEVAAGPTLRFAGLELQYFLLAWLPQNFDENNTVTVLPAAQVAGLLAESTTPAAADGLVLRGSQSLGHVGQGQTRKTSFTLYLGPKRDAELMAVDTRLANVIDYNMLGVPLGFLARPMMFFMRLFHQWTHSWGLAIVLLTLLVKTLLLPANLKSGANIKRMQKLKPELDVLSKRLKGDPQKLQSEQMALYRKHNVNPASGCLPLLLQIPVWLTLYRSLASAVDLYKQPFLWLTDLTATEPIPVLALTAGGFTILQQRLTPMAADSQQAKVMMYVLPAMVTLFMVNMPAGLTLYILVNSILTLLQQVVINRRAV